jgi:OFA family oxalate/formate antiporter-like MFS transporter
MLKTWQFYAIWGMFVFGSLAGLMVIGNIVNFARNVTEGFPGHGYSAEQAADLAVIGAAICYPILNGTGRIVWGSSSDKIGNRKALLLMSLLQAVAVVTYIFTTANPYMFFVTTGLIAFNFGGNLALFPPTTAEFFGNKDLGANYGLVFTAYGVGGLVGPVLAGLVQDYGLSFTFAFTPASALCLAAAILAFIMRRPGT